MNISLLLWDMFIEQNWFLYTLKMTLAEAVQYMETKKAQDTEQAKANIQRLKDLAPYL
jgi:predicted transcriptional regulator